MIVKICGLKDVAMLDVCIKAGATHFGMVFFEKSPRNISLEQAVKLVDFGKDTIKSVALLVNPADDFVVKIATDLKPDFIQLHGHESVARVKEIKALTSIPLIKALPIGVIEDLLAIDAYLPLVSMILLDAKPPANTDLPGGNGLPFDWDLLKNLDLDARFMLSGGLTPLNIAKAIDVTGVKAVDVSSGVEKIKGVKDASLIEAFVLAAKGANHV